MDFRALAFILNVSTLISGVAGIIFANCRFGVWSLVYQVLIQKLVLLLFYVFYGKWIPAFRFSWQSVKKFAHFSVANMGSYLLQQIVARIDLILIGKILNPVAVGYYQRAQSFNQLPATFCATVVNKSLYPVLSRLQDKLGEWKAILNQFEKWITIAIVPLYGFLFLAADEIILLLFGTQWLAVVPIFKGFCFTGFLWPLTAIKVTGINTLGNSLLNFKIGLFLSLVKLGAFIIILLSFASFDVQMFVLVYNVFFILTYVLYCIMLARMTKTLFRDQVKVLLYILGLSTLITAGGIFLVPFPAGWLGLILKFFYFFSIYFFVLSFTSYRSFIMAGLSKVFGRNKIVW